MLTQGQLIGYTILATMSICGVVGLVCLVHDKWSVIKTLVLKVWTPLRKKSKRRQYRIVKDKNNRFFVQTKLKWLPRGWKALHGRHFKNVYYAESWEEAFQLAKDHKNGAIPKQWKTFWQCDAKIWMLDL
jgi:hypothetical protein